MTHLAGVTKSEVAVLSSTVPLSCTTWKAGPSLGATRCLIFSRPHLPVFFEFSFSDPSLCDCEALPASVPIPVKRPSLDGASSTNTANLD